MKFTLESKFGDVEIIETRGDLPSDVLDRLASGTASGIDTETSGLDWGTDELGLVQVYFEELGCVYLVRPNDSRPQNLIELLRSEKWVKVFHYALFDLRFLARRWSFEPQNVRCTKIASKLLAPTMAKHSLAGLLASRLDVEISKDRRLRLSDWTSDELSKEQLTYAALDVMFLPQLFEHLLEELRLVGRSELADRCFSLLPDYLKAELLGVHELFGY